MKCKNGLALFACFTLLILSACAPSAATTVAPVKPTAEEPAVPTAAPTNTQEKPTAAPTETATAPEPVEITWLVRGWYSSEVSVGNEIIANFEAKYPSIKVRQVVDDNNSRRMLSAMINNATPPDIWVPGWTIPFAEVYYRDLIADLTPFIERDGFDLADFTPYALDLFKKDGKIMAIPFMTGGSFIFYNKDLFDQAGVPYPPTDWTDTTWTWEAFVKNCQALTHLSDPYKPATDQFGVFMTLEPPWEQVILLRGFDPFPPSAYETGFSEEAQFDSPEAIQAIQAVQDLMFTTHCFPQYKEINSLWSGYNPFVSQRIAMYWTGVWGFADYYELSQFKWGVGAFPNAAQGRKDIVYTDSWVISKDAPHPEEAWTFLKYLASPEVQALWMQKTGFPPARLSLLPAWYKQFPSMTPAELEQAYTGALQFGHESPANLLVDYYQLNKEITGILNLPILNGWKKAAEVLPAANAVVVKTLKEIKEKYGK